MDSPVGDMDQSGDPYIDQFINGRAEARSRRSDDIQFFEPSMNVLLFLMVKKFVYLEVLLILAGSRPPCALVQQGIGHSLSEFVLRGSPHISSSPISKFISNHGRALHSF